MRFLHTSDIHIGKKLNGFSLHEEHREYFSKLLEICEDKEVKIVIVAGDVFNVSNPDFESEKIFYKGISDLSDNGKRIVIVCAGNHDSSKKIDVASSLALDKGIIFVPTIASKVNNGENFENDIFKIYDIEEGCFRLKLDDDVVSVVSLGYPSLENINIYKELFKEDEEKLSYKEKISKIINIKNEYFNDNTINLFIGHMYVGGTYEFCESETDFNVGGLYDINSSSLPKKADYIALGHLHKKQKIKGFDNAFYCGSPYPFSKSEANHKKYVILFDVDNKKLEVSDVEIRLKTTVKSIVFKSIEDLIQFSKGEEHINKYMFITLVDDSYNGVNSAENSSIVHQALSCIDNVVEFNVKDTFEAEDYDVIYKDVRELDIYDEFKTLAEREVVDITEEKVNELFELFDELLKG